MYESEYHANNAIQFLHNAGWIPQSGSVLRSSTRQLLVSDKAWNYFLDTHLTHKARPEHLQILSRSESVGVDHYGRSSTQAKERIQMPTINNAQLLFSFLGGEQHKKLVRLLPSLILLVKQTLDQELQQFARIALYSKSAQKASRRIDWFSETYHLPALILLRSLLVLNKTPVAENIECLFHYRISGAACNVTELYVADCRCARTTQNPLGLLKFLMGRQKLRIVQRTKASYSGLQYD